MANTNGISSLQNLLGSLAVNGAKAANPDAKAGDAAAATRVFSGKLDAASLSVAGGFAAQASGGTDIRFTKVAALQQAIANGTYSVPASEVAGKMIEALMG